MTIALFILVLLLLVVGHEFGHFIVAKLTKMKVLEFGVGFPPRLWGYTIGETVYTINWLPFGGFVKIFGEDIKETGESAMASRPALEQAAVMAAGPFANIVLAFALSSMAYAIGVPTVVESIERVAGQVVVGDVLAGSPASVAGLKAGDQVVSVKVGEETVPITLPKDLSEAVSRAPGPVTMHVLRGGEELSFDALPATNIVQDEPGRRALGISTALVVIERLPIHRAVWEGLVDTVSHFWLIIVSLVALIASIFTFSADLSTIAGPVGIAAMTGDAAAFGLGSLFSFAALLSINLAVVNLLPFPALDGGRLVFLGIEAAMRRRIPPAVAHAVNTAGFALLILLMLLVTAQDVGKLVG